MASSDVLAIERLALDDVAGGLALSDAAGWNQSADDWSFFIAAGAALGVRDEAANADRDGRGACLTTPPPAGSRWCSSTRRTAIAASPASSSMPASRRCARPAALPVLDATPAGAAVYAKIGFVAGFAFERWEGDGAATIAATGAESGIAAAAVAGRDTDRARPQRLRRRSRAPAAIVPRPARHARLARSARRAASRCGAPVDAPRRSVRSSPPTTPPRSSCLDLALDGIAGRVFIDVPVHRTSIADALTRRGFVRQRPFVRMALGDAGAAAARERVFALAGPEFG